MMGSQKDRKKNYDRIIFRLDPISRYLVRCQNKFLDVSAQAPFLLSIGISLEAGS